MASRHLLAYSDILARQDVDPVHYTWQVGAHVWCLLALILQTHWSMGTASYWYHVQRLFASKLCESSWQSGSLAGSTLSILFLTVNQHVNSSQQLPGTWIHQSWTGLLCVLYVKEYGHVHVYPAKCISCKHYINNQPIVDITLIINRQSVYIQKGYTHRWAPCIYSLTFYVHRLLYSSTQ